MAGIRSLEFVEASLDEIISSYTGLWGVMIYRLTHELQVRGVPRTRPRQSLRYPDSAGVRLTALADVCERVQGESHLSLAVGESHGEACCPGGQRANRRVRSGRAVQSGACQDPVSHIE